MKDKIFLTIGIACLIYYAVCGFYGGFKISALWIWLAAGLGFAAVGLGLYKGFWAMTPQLLKTAVRLGVCLFLAVFLFVEALVATGMTSVGEPDLDYIIVLGAAVKGDKPGRALKLRIDAACRYLEENPRTIAIVSGGQGPGEDITEAECMERELVRMGVPSGRIIQENRSATTAENIRFSYELIGQERVRVGVLSNNFHVYRAAAIARKQGAHPVCPVAAPYSGILLPHYMVREFLTITVDRLLGNL